MRNNDTANGDLIERAQEAWDALDLQVLKNLPGSMPRRVQAIIRSCDEWYTKY